MTYVESLQNIAKLTNLVVPIDLSDNVVFNFSSVSEFKILFYDHSEFRNIITNLIQTGYRSGLPVANIVHDEAEQEILYYEDKIVRYSFNLTTQEILIHDHKIGLRSPSSAELALEMNKLLFKLKNL